VAELGGVMVLEITSEAALTDAKLRRAIHKEVEKRHLEHLLIFVDPERSRSLWSWVKREDGKVFPRDHLYVKGQPGDLFLGKLSGIVFDLGDFDETGNVSVVQVAGRLKDALDVERTTKKFYREFQAQHLEFLSLISGIPDERKRRWYASVLLNRLMFIYFLQRKGFIDGGKLNYLQEKLELINQQGKNYYEDFLKPLFFEGFAKPAEHRSEAARSLLGNIKYLNGGLFLEHSVEREFPDIAIPNVAFENLLSLFRRYSWNLNDLPGEDDDEINPDVLGYIFEKYINQKAFGAYYTRPEITEYLCEGTINRLILEAVNVPNVPGLPQRKHFDSVPELLVNLDAQLCRQLLLEVLPNLSLLDPACGSGAFLVAALKTLINIYSAVLGKIDFLNDATLKDWYTKVRREHPSVSYFIKKRIITDNLYGVDLMEEATDIAKLRLFLALVASADTVEQLEPLPNIDFNIMSGNSLVGLMRVDDADFERHHGAQGNLFRRSYRELVDEKNRKIAIYKQQDRFAENLTEMRQEIRDLKKEAQGTLNEILLDEFGRLGIKFEEATWDAERNKAGKAKKRPLRVSDIEALTPFHWGYEFDTILNERGGFDAIITNPPWDIFKPNAKEFFQEHSELVSKKKMDIKAFEKEQARLLQDAEVRSAWEEYLSSFPHVSEFYRKSPQYPNQIGYVNGRKVGSDINLYKLFTEQCYNLLRPGGQCGIVIPSGIYTDLGAKQLREMLFNETQVTGLFCFENRREIFENVHRSFKIVVLTFQKGGHTETFPAAFMRHDVKELEEFPEQIGLEVSVELVRRLSPDSLSVMEFKNDLDVQIAEKMLRFPLLGERLEGTWNLVLTNEFHMTNDSHLFKTEAAPGRLPLYEGKMIHQFTHTWGEPKYWIDEKEAKKILRKTRLSRFSQEVQPHGSNSAQNQEAQKFDYETYRLAFREIARNTDSRTMIATILPKNVFANHKLMVSTKQRENNLSRSSLLFAAALLNSFCFDFSTRQTVTTSISMFMFYQLSMPRLTEKDPAFTPIVERAAKLICTTPEFDDLAASVGATGRSPLHHRSPLQPAPAPLQPAMDPAERARLRAELDGLVAHLYGLSEDEFAYIFTTFPLVEQSVKDAALLAYRNLAPQPGDPEIARLIAAGEGERLEFKSTARWNIRSGAQDKKMEEVIAKTVSAFLNADGGTLLIGVADDGEVLGLENDFKTLGKKPNRDGFELFLTDLLFKGKLHLSGLISFSFHDVSGKTVCKVAVKPSPQTVWTEVGGVERFFVRTGNSTRELSPSETLAYVRRRWG